jgi:hypothetical protein
MQNSALSLVATKALPALSGSSLTYNPEKNVYLTMGHTSTAGNTYFKAVRFSNRLAVYYDIGIGYCRTFLNGITLFCWDGREAKIVAQKFWGGCGNWCDFSERFAQGQAVQMLKDYLKGQAKMLGKSIDEQQLFAFSKAMVDETNQRRIA